MESPFVHDVSDDDFEQRVIARSREVPVVVDFWAAWCGPCRALGPVLEREVDSLAGRVELAKVDTDRSPRFASRYGVRSIPAVMAFRDGEVVDDFVGAQPPAVVRAFLARLAPPPEQQALERAEAARRAGDHANAKKLAEELLATEGLEPALAGRAALLLAEMLIAEGRLDEMEVVLARVDSRGPLVERAETLRQLAAFVKEGQTYGGEERARAALATGENDLEARYALAAALAGSGRHAESLEQLLEIVGRSRKFRDDGARRAMLLIFELLGADSDLARDSRRRLQVLT